MVQTRKTKMLNQQNITTKPGKICCCWPSVQTAIQIKAKLLSGQEVAATNRNLKTIGQTRAQAGVMLYFSDEFMGGDPLGKASPPAGKPAPGTRKAKKSGEDCSSECDS